MDSFGSTIALRSQLLTLPLTGAHVQVSSPSSRTQNSNNVYNVQILCDRSEMQAETEHSVTHSAACIGKAVVASVDKISLIAQLSTTAKARFSRRILHMNQLYMTERLFIMIHI